MPFRIGNLIVTVVHPHIDAMVPSPPLPPAASGGPRCRRCSTSFGRCWRTPQAQLAGQEDASLAPPRTLTEATALVQYLEIALREAQQVKEQFASAHHQSDRGTRE